jgi:lantibiotic biosynthesis protein
VSPGGELGPDRRGGDALRDSGFFAFRVPALAMDVLTQWAEGMEAPVCPPEDLEGALDRDRLRLGERLMEIAGRPEVTAALSVASPDLVDALRGQDGDPGVESALVRYVSRMASRPTPFGLFAACGVGEIGERTHLALPDLACWRRHTRLDGDYLDRVVRGRAAALRGRLTFRPNDSLYRIGGRWRYVQARLDGLARTHHLAEIGDSDHLTRALAACEAGARPADVAAAVAAGGVAQGAAKRYVDELVEAQVLLAELAVPITGQPPLDALIDDLEAVGDGGTVAVLSAVRDELAAIDAQGAEGGPGRQDGVAALLGELPVPAGRARLLQVDTTVPQCGATLARSVVEDVVRGVELLRRIAPAPEPTELDRFREAFIARYEEREVPLLEALDDDLGAGFGAGGGDPAPLLKGLVLPPAERQATIGRRERRLLELMHRAWAPGALEVSLRPDDVAELERDDALPLPGAVGAMASIARTPEGLRVLVSFASGPPGVRLLGRFCHPDPVLDARVRAHLRAEEALEPDAIHAEIAHLPSGLLSNVLARPVLREWELEWLGRSGAPPERRLPVSDLLVSHRGGRFVLRSRSLGREVLPRLTSSHDWSHRSPSVYRFLAAIQSQGTAGSVGWSWAPLDRAPFTPRVRWGRLILALAAWRAPRSELRELDGHDPVSRWRAVQTWRQRRRLPRWIRLVEGDNKLAIDLDNALSVDTFVRMTRRRESALIEELYPRPDELIAEAGDGHHALELVIPLVRSAAAPAGVPTAGLTRPKRPASDARQTAAPLRQRRTFPPGSEWTYLKLCTGPASADSLLRQMIAPLARELISSGAADRWFFLRYGDPRFHLRVRFHGEDPAILESVRQLAARALEAGLAQDAELGTYPRAIQRYGGADGILVAERLFHADSDAVVALLDMFEPGERGLEERWQIGVLGSDALMCDLGLDDQARAAVTRHMHAALEREVQADARLRNATAGRVRAELGTVDALLAATADSNHPLAPGIAVLARRSERIRPLVAELADLRAAGSLDLPPDALATTYVHMWLNRLCRSQNRFQEYVTYALLARALRARVAREDARR